MSPRRLSPRWSGHGQQAIFIDFDVRQRSRKLVLQFVGEQERQQVNDE
ncbi:hypothetical protein ACFL1R_05625 [Candidatus Latescibacterota bacterium]